MFRIRRAAVVAFGAAAFGAFGLASPAVAGVTITPTEAPRGQGVKVTFQIPEERPGAQTTKVELVVPRETPIGEVYPMSSNDWAPITTVRDLSAPVAGLHGTTSQVTDRITWTRVSGRAAAGQAIPLIVSMGPMPVQGDQVVFELVQTYSDGTVVRWGAADPAHPAVTIKLTDGAPGGGSHHGGTAQQQQQQTVAASSTEDTGGSYAILSAGLLAGLGLGAAGLWFITRSRRKPTESA
ncbi:DUF1775 domain-containing protein [Actinomycetes bacterium KLBMP 9797]